ncbi:MAG: DUF4349 domain-containing protein [Lachnospiraceae bacterium]|nr:DUF4349 domain-containing protein [Lachnospiraceae bacterium]
MKRDGRVAFAFAVLLTMVLVITSCGGSSSASTADYAAREEGAYEYPDDAAYGAAAAEAYDMEVDADDYYDEAKSANSAEQPAEIGMEAAESAQKLVYTCWMTIQTLEFDQTQAAVKEAVKKTGSIIESESVNDSNYSWYYDSYKKKGTLSSTLRIRVPSSKYEEFLGLLDGVGGKVTSKSQNVENITKRYNDQAIYIESLETQEKRLLEMMEKADTVEEMITVEARLTDVQTQLNQARSDLASMDTDVKYSTVNLTLEEVVKYTDTPKTPVSFGERLANAVKESWENFGEFLQNLLITIVYLIPAILLIAVIAIIVIIAMRAWRKKHPKIKKEKKQTAYDQRNFFRRPGGPAGGSVGGSSGGPIGGSIGGPAGGPAGGSAGGPIGSPAGGSAGGSASGPAGGPGQQGFNGNGNRPGGPVANNGNPYIGAENQGGASSKMGAKQGDVAPDPERTEN